MWKHLIGLYGKHENSIRHERNFKNQSTKLTEGSSS